MEALRHGRSIWTSDDLEAACVSANVMARPWGFTGPSPEQRWTSRRPLTAACRRDFRNALAATKAQVMIEKCVRPEDLQRRAVRSAVDRTAIRRTLERLGYLFVLGAPIRPQLNSEKGALIT